MGMNFKVTGVLVGVAVLTGCASITTNSWRAPANEFPESATYSWASEGLEVGGDPRINQEFLAPRIITAVDAALNEKGYRKEEKNASYLLKPSVRLADKDEQYASPPEDGTSASVRFQRMGNLDWEWVVPNQVNVDVYEEGTLLLTVMDTTSDKTVWQGSASLRVDRDQSPQQKEKLLKKVVRALMASFPDGPARSRNGPRSSSETESNESEQTGTSSRG